MKTLVIAVAAWIAITWSAVTFLKLKRSEAWALRGGLAAIGVAGAAAWTRLRPHAKPKDGAPAAPPKDAAAELNLLVRDASQKLRGSAIGDLPLFYVLGERGSAKTSTILNCGLDPELLAGQLYQADAVVPTRTANIWVAGRTLFAELGGALLGDEGACLHFVSKLRPRRAAAVFIGKRQAPRAALVCVNAEMFTGPGASQASQNLARVLHDRLTAIGARLGVQLPVYVLFTKADRIPYFTPFVRNLTRDEVSQAFGVAMAPPPRSGVYADEQGRRVAAAFDELFKRAAAARPDHLSREQNASLLSDVYEFPREFRKIQAVITQFLVDLCRPPQLTAAPFLRGFYFSGVRPVLMEDIASDTPASAAPVAAAPDAGATRIFNAAADFGLPGAAPAKAPVFGGRKVPQWVFLTQLFHAVLLGDRSALAAGSDSAKTRMGQYVLLGAAALVALVFAIGMTFSFFSNRDVTGRAIESARQAWTIPPGPGRPPSVESLRALDSLREQIEKIREYEQRRPLGLRWGLYHAHDALPLTVRAYYDSFRRLLLAPTQDRLVTDLNAVPPAATSDQPFDQLAYDKLKAYLITTSHHEKSTREFLAPNLTAWWSPTVSADPERTGLAGKQFAFYATGLRRENPYSSENDRDAIAHARAYLNSFTAEDKLYKEAVDGVQAAPVVFNQVYPDSAGIVVNRYEVPGAFTAAAFKSVHDKLKALPQREQWVLGESDDGHVLSGVLSRYQDAYIEHWRKYLRSGTFTGYANLKDAARKLALVSSPQSAVLRMLALASSNVGVDEEVKKSFVAVQKVTPPPATEIVSDANKPYLIALQNLQIPISQASETPTPIPAVVQQAQAQAGQARAQVGQLKLAFGTDPTGDAIAKLMSDPIIAAERVLQRVKPAELNAKGKALCDKYRGLYPLYAGSKKDIPLPELRKLLQKPDGALWKLYADLRDNLVQQGTDYVPSPDSTVAFTPNFLRFFKQAARASDVMYGAGGAQESVPYAIQFVPDGSTVNAVTLMVNGKNYELSAASPAASLVWPAADNQDFEVLRGGFPLLKFDGLWSPFRFLEGRERWDDTSGIGTWPVYGGAGMTRTGTLRFKVTGRLLELKSALAFGCVAEIAH